MLRRPRPLLLAALAGACLIALVRIVAFDFGPARSADARVLEGFAGLDRDRVRPVANAIANLASPKPFAVFALILVAVALFRGRPRTALAAGIVLAFANVTTQLLKPAFPAPRSFHLPFGAAQLGDSAWPSGHATASMALALTAVLVAGPRLRPLLSALGAAFTLAVCFSFLILKWHFPSDVVAGYLVAGTWTALALAGLAAGQRYRPASLERRYSLSLRAALAPAAALVALGAALAVLVVLYRPEAVLHYVRAHKLFVIGAVAIGAAGLSLATGLTLVLQRAPRRDSAA